MTLPSTGRRRACRDPAGSATSGVGRPRLESSIGSKRHSPVRDLASPFCCVRRQSVRRLVLVGHQGRRLLDDGVDLKVSTSFAEPSGWVTQDLTASTEGIQRRPRRCRRRLHTSPIGAAISTVWLAWRVPIGGSLDRQRVECRPVVTSGPPCHPGCRTPASTPPRHGPAATVGPRPGSDCPVQRLVRTRGQGGALDGGDDPGDRRRRRNPDARMVLLKGWDERGFRFFTNRESAKSASSRQILAAPVLYWRELMGKSASAATSSDSTIGIDEYFASPARFAARAWAALDRPIADRAELDGLLAAAEQRFAGEEVNRAAALRGGFLVRPRAIEFWQGQVGRLHDRFVLTGRRLRRLGDRAARTLGVEAVRSRGRPAQASHSQCLAASSPARDRDVSPGSRSRSGGRPRTAAGPGRRSLPTWSARRRWLGDGPRHGHGPLSIYRHPLLGTGVCGASTTFSTVKLQVLRCSIRPRRARARLRRSASAARRPARCRRSRPASPCKGRPPVSKRGPFDRRRSMRRSRKPPGRPRGGRPAVRFTSATPFRLGTFV